jgi:arginyl-tRNA synthetase
LIKDKIVLLIEEAMRELQESGKFRLDESPPIELERPKDKAHGDWATNVALALAGQLKRSPRNIAEQIAERIASAPYLRKVEAAGAGFINFCLSDDWFYEAVSDLLRAGGNFGRSDLGQGLSVQVEFVSANPVGPMHIGHGRWAAVGDTLSNILAFTGHRVTREFYINDHGTQMNIFGKSVAARYSELLGQGAAFPPEGYRGEYIKDIAREIIEKDGDKHLSLSAEEREELFRERAYRQVLEHMKRTLERMGIGFEVWFSEKELHRSGAITEAIEELREKGLVYEKEGALWLKTTDYGDDKDRVLIRETGEPTYYASDIAYHKNKHSRGFDRVIDIWGADHHGYVARVKAAMTALGYPLEFLEIIIGQLVNLLRGGEPVKMSKRTGELVTLEELLDEVGKDPVRFLFLMSDANNAIDFDIELAKRESAENPVYYVQYAHARISSILRYAAEQDSFFLALLEEMERGTIPDLTLLKEESEFDLMRKLLEFEELVEKCARFRQPQHLTRYGQELASHFHVFYTKCRVVTQDKELSQARLSLVRATQIVLASLLRLMGVEAPEKM